MVTSFVLLYMYHCKCSKNTLQYIIHLILLICQCRQISYCSERLINVVKTRNNCLIEAFVTERSENIEGKPILKR